MIHLSNIIPMTTISILLQKLGEVIFLQCDLLPNIGFEINNEFYQERIDLCFTVSFAIFLGPSVIVFLSWHVASLDLFKITF